MIKKLDVYNYHLQDILRTENVKDILRHVMY